MVQFLSLSALKFPKLVAIFFVRLQGFRSYYFVLPNVTFQGFRVQNFQLRVSKGGYKNHFGKYIYYLKLQLP